MVIFNSYVKLPEGTPIKILHIFVHFSLQEMAHQQLQPDLITSAALSRRLELGGAVAVAASLRCCRQLELQGMALLRRR
jgi:hypothetical protein